MARRSQSQAQSSRFHYPSERGLLALSIPNHAESLSVIPSGSCWSRGTPILFRLLLVPTDTQIAPRGIRQLDQPNFLVASPTLELLFPSDGRRRGREFLEAHQPIDVVSRGKARHFLHLVLVNSPLEIVGNSYVESPREARDDVHEIARAAWLHSLPSRATV